MWVRPAARYIRPEPGRAALRTRHWCTVHAFARSVFRIASRFAAWLDTRRAVQFYTLLLSASHHYELILNVILHALAGRRGSPCCDTAHLHACLRESKILVIDEARLRLRAR